MAVVVTTELGRTFGHGRTAVVALHGVSGRVEAGQTIALVGASGSGKSTLLHLLAGLDTPTAGRIEWPEIGERSSLRPGPVGIVFQGPSLLDSLDVVENTALPLVLAGTDPVVAWGAAADELDRLGLGQFVHALPQELSGGQAQRVAVARALVGQPSLILADEPTGQLDHDGGRRVVEALLHGARRSGAALVVATHDPMVAGAMSQRWDVIDGWVVTAPREHPTEVPR